MTAHSETSLRMAKLSGLQVYTGIGCVANAMWDEMQLQATYTISRDCEIGLDEPDGLMDLLSKGYCVLVSVTFRPMCKTFYRETGHVYSDTDRHSCVEL